MLNVALNQRLQLGAQIIDSQNELLFVQATRGFTVHGRFVELLTRWEHQHGRDRLVMVLQCASLFLKNFQCVHGVDFADRNYTKMPLPFLQQG